MQPSTQAGAADSGHHGKLPQLEDGRAQLVGQSGCDAPQVSEEGIPRSALADSDEIAVRTPSDRGTCGSRVGCTDQLGDRVRVVFIRFVPRRRSVPLAEQGQEFGPVLVEQVSRLRGEHTDHGERLWLNGSAHRRIQGLRRVRCRPRALRADGAGPIDPREDRHQDDGQGEHDQSVADRGRVADLVDVEGRVRRSGPAPAR